MNESVTTESTTELPSDNGEKPEVLPVLLVAYKPPDSLPIDHFVLNSSAPFLIGRRTQDNHLSSDDHRISKYHAKVFREADVFWIQDLKSTNGTFVNGQKIVEKCRLIDGSLIRVGQTLLVFHTNGQKLLAPLRSDRFGIAGQFHVMPLIKKLEEAAASARHILLAGPSGAGKELAAAAFAKLTKQAPFIAYNAARYTSEDEVAATLFGVARRVFSSVDARAGLIENAAGGVLFLDEVHNLPERIQKSLLRVIEDGQLSRIGETKTQQTDVRFVFASNAPAPLHGLTEDFFARLRVVQILPLNERIADIPAIFDHIFHSLINRHRLDMASITGFVGATQYEKLCIYGFPQNNVRGLYDLADRIVTRIQADVLPRQAVREIFSEHFPPSKPTGLGFSSGSQITQSGHTPQDTVDLQEGLTPAQQLATVRSRYEENKEVIIRVFNDCGGVIKITCQELLLKNNLKLNPRWLSIFLSRWGIRPQERYKEEAD